MINDLQIFTRENNKFNYPNTNWSIKNTILVSGNIELGLNDKIIFNQDNSPTLSKVIKLGQIIRNQNKGISIKFQGYKKKIRILNYNWNEIKIYSGWEDDGPLILNQKKVFVQEVNEMFNKIYSQLEGTNKEIRNYYFDLIRPRGNNSQAEKIKFKFRPGDKVKTNPVKNLLRERKGMIWGMNYHSKDGYFYYLIFTDGRIHGKRYLENELILNEE